MCQCIFDTIRSIPIFSIVGFLIATAGAGTAYIGYGTMEKAFDTLGLSTEHDALNGIWALFGATLCLNLAALLSAVPATGKTRELCFSRRGGSCVGCIKCLIGQGAQGMIFLLLCASFMLLFGCVLLFLPAGTLLVLASGACKAGSDSVAALQKALEQSENTEMMDISAAELKKFCDAGLDITKTVGYLVAGAAVCMVAQVWLLVTTSNNYTKVRLQPEISDPERPLQEEPEYVIDYGSSSGQAQAQAQGGQPYVAYA